MSVSCRHFAGSRSQRLLACGQQRQHYWNARGRLWRDTPAVGRRDFKRNCSGRLQHALHRVRPTGGQSVYDVRWNIQASTNASSN